MKHSYAQYRPRKYMEIEHVPCKDVGNGRVEKPVIFAYGQPNSKNTVQVEAQEPARCQTLSRASLSGQI